MLRNIIKLPIVLVLIFALLMYVVEILNINATLNFTMTSPISLGIFGLGLLILLVSAVSFRQASTTLNPLTPENTSKLVTRGIYQFSRNPMYLGFLLWLVAWAGYLGNPINIILLPVYIILVNKFYILPEERMLEKLFGIEYANYKKRVRRWL